MLKINLNSLLFYIFECFFSDIFIVFYKTLLYWCYKKKEQIFSLIVPEELGHTEYEIF
jgi:hypothetical protein